MHEKIYKDMLSTIRKAINESRKDKTFPIEEDFKPSEKDNFVSRARILMEEAEGESSGGNSDNNANIPKGAKGFPITKSTPQFGDVRSSQETSLVKTIGEQIKLKDDALVYYPDIEDLAFNGIIPSMNLRFQFRLNDNSGQGVYIWAEGLQLTEDNSRTLGKIRDAFLNWKANLVQDGDLMDKLKKASEKW